MTSLQPPPFYTLENNYPAKMITLQITEGAQQEESSLDLASASLRYTSVPTFRIKPVISVEIPYFACSK